MSMETETGKIRISILDVMYGVVLTYGFSYYDQIQPGPELFRFIFSYLIIIYDFLYVHEQYWKRDYPILWLFIDIVILFSFTRIIANSVGQSNQFYFWLFFLFLFYAIWDVSNIHYTKRTGDRTISYEDMKLTLATDVTAMIAYLSLGVYLAVPEIGSPSLREIISTHHLASQWVFSVLALLIFCLAARQWWKSQRVP
jgi:hypothetical protein